MERKLAGAAAAAGVAYFATRGGSAAPSTGAPSGNQQQQNADGRKVAETDQFDPATGANEVVSPGNTADQGEVGTDPSVGGGVVYDDPEDGGPNDDEAADDSNATFNDVNEVADQTDIIGTVDPSTYAPDVQDGSTAPSSGGVIADQGDSNNWGLAPEQENDDLTERAADSNLSDDTKSAFDRLANYDDPDNL